MTSPLHTEILRRLEEIGRPATASVISRAGEQISLGRVWGALDDLWDEKRVEGYPNGPWSLVARVPVAGQMTMGEDA